MNIWQRYIHAGILVALLVWIGFPLLTPGFIPTHDGEYHLIRIWQFGKMLASGTIFPRWAPDLNSGYGLPLFNFQYPFPNYIGVLWHWIGVSLADSVKLTLATGYTGAVVFCYLWLAQIFAPFAALFGTIAFATVPYWFVNMYVRGSVGEVLAMMWVMMTLWAIERRSVRIVAVGIALLVVTHNISAMIWFPVIGMYLLLKRPRMWQALGLGIGMASYFWIPALLERQYMTGLNTVNFAEHFPALYQLLIPSWGTGFSGVAMSGNQMSFQIGIFPLLLFVASAVIVGKRLVSGRHERMAVYWGAVMAGAIIVMMPVSVLLWQMFPILGLVQYPWRFLALLIVPAGFFGAYVATRLPKVVSLALVVFGVFLVSGYVRPVAYPPRSDAYYLSRKNFTDGTSSLGDSLSTVWSGWKKIRPEAVAEIGSGKGFVVFSEKTPGGVTGTIRADGPVTVRINVLYYPGWKLTVDGQRAEAIHDGGVLAVRLPGGQHRFTAEFGETGLRVASDALSVLSVVYLLFVSVRGAARPRKQRR